MAINGTDELPVGDYKDLYFCKSLINLNYGKNAGLIIFGQELEILTMVDNFYYHFVTNLRKKRCLGSLFIHLIV